MVLNIKITLPESENEIAVLEESAAPAGVSKQAAKAPQNYRIYEGRVVQARVIAVAEKVIRVEVSSALS